MSVAAWQILAESGAPRGSLYFHFPGGKEELAVAAVRAMGTRIAPIIAQLLGTHADPAAAIDAFVRAFAEILRASDYAEGCPVATVTLEAAAGSAPIRAACDEAYTEWQRQISAYLAGAGVPAAEADPLATLVLAAAEGGLILSRARHGVEPLETVAAQLATILRSAVAESGKRKRR